MPPRKNENALAVSDARVGWSAWQRLAGWAPSATVLAETLDGGQAFRWRQDADGAWTGAWADCVAQLRLAPAVASDTAAGVALEWRAPAAIAARVEAALPRYLGAEHDWAALADALPWRSDVHLAQCASVFRGLRLLRQPFGETLLGFLCSATKQIVQIKQMVALLAERHGAEIARAEEEEWRDELPRGRGAVRTAASQVLGCPVVGEVSKRWRGFRRLPTWAELAAIPESELRACLLGFRARYIAETAQFLAARPGWLDATEAAPYPEAQARLMELPGVGEKVADCVLLFGAGKLEAFPVDTWILKSLARRYGVDGWKPAQVAQFGRVHFGPLAGFAQQFLFAWERRHGGR
ncbi:MAG: DNA-binding protein [Opitutae bacterium]|nr:DNA-binding protein [Opitutae bacterium]